MKICPILPSICLPNIPHKAKIIEFHLMKTVAKTSDGKIVYIPNLKFNESVILISKG